MKTVEVMGKGDSARLQIGSRDKPSPDLKQVLIKVAAAGVNRADILQRLGKYPPPEGVSDILGLEVAGTICEISKDVKGLHVGDRVCALLDGGGYAQYALANAECVLPVPDNMDFELAAALPEALFTVWSNLFIYAKMQKGESLLVHGGTSGIGVMAVQIAKAFGIECYATAGTDEKCEFLDNLGVDTSVNYNDTDFVSIIKDIGGVDVVLDMVGGDYFQKNLDILKPSGRLVCIAMMKGAKTDINFAPLLLKNLTIMGTTLRNKPLEFKAQVAKELQEKVWPKVEQGAIKPVIDSVFDLPDAQKAHDLMQSSKHIGKIILKV